MITIHLAPSKEALGHSAAARGGDAIRAAIAKRGSANIVVATGASQFETLSALVRSEGIDWPRVTAFHLDEYIDIPPDHPASFRRYLEERFTSLLPGLGCFHFISGTASGLPAEIERLNALMARHPIDVTFAGIGENAHLAFNDPPADFDAAEAFRVVTLDEKCRRQQFNEGWFPTLAEVPHEAISMTVPQIMKSALVILAVPDRRKAEAVRDVIEGPITPMVPASILRRHPSCHLFLDPQSAELMRRVPEAAGE